MDLVVSSAEGSLEEQFLPLTVWVGIHPGEALFRMVQPSVHQLLKSRVAWICLGLPLQSNSRKQTSMAHLVHTQL